MADIKILIDSSDAVTAEKRIDQLGKSGGVAGKGLSKASRGMNQFGEVSAKGGKKLNTFNMQIQQGGYQLQDFVVQLQGGTSVFTAFGQQGSQFAGVFGPQGAVIGAVIAIGSAIGGIGYKALTASTQVKSFEDQLKDTSSVMEDYISLASKADNVFGSLFETSRTALSQTSQASKDLLLIAKTEALDSIRGLGGSLADASTEAGFWAKAMLNTDKVITGNLLNIDTALRGNITVWKDTGKQVQSFIDEVRNIGEADSIDAMYQSALKARDIFQDTVDVTKEMTEKQSTFWKQLSTTILNLEVMGATVDALNGKWSDTKEAIDASIASIKLFYDYADRDAAAQEKRASAVERIKKSLADVISSEARRVELIQAGANIDEVVARHAREDFITQQQSNMVLGNNLTIALKSYDAAALALKTESERTASLTLRGEEEKSLAEANDRYAKDAERVAAAAAKEAEKLLNLTAQISASTPYEPMSAVAAEAVKSQAEMIKVFESTIALKEEIGLAAYEALRLSGVDMASPISAASIEAAKLAGNLGIALIAAVNLSNAQTRTPSGARFNGENRNFGRGSTGVTEGYQNEQGYESIDSQIAAFNAKKLRESKAGGGSSSSGPDPVEKLRQQIELNRQLVGLSKEEATVLTQVNSIQNSLGEDRNKYSRETIVGLIEQNEAYKEQQLVIEEAKAQQDALAETITNSMETAFMSIIDGTASAKDAFKSMASEIIKELLRILVVEKAVESIRGFIGGFGGGSGGGVSSSPRPPVRPMANGGAFSGGSQVQAYANGGVVNGPTNFPMSGNKMGLMGEAGPEAIMPLKRGANGKLGVQTEGGGGGDVIHISQSFNFQANGDETVKKLIAQAAPKIAQMTKSSMIDDRRRGGVTKSAFG